MGAKTRTYWQQKLQSLITEKNPELDVEFGPIFDSVVYPVSVALEELYGELDKVSILTDLSRWQEWSDDDIDRIASNYGLVRREGTKAYGEVIFYSATRPTVDVKIPADTAVATVDGIMFRVLTPLEVSVSNVDAYKNVVTGRYEFPVFVESIETGKKNNVAPGSIVVIQGSVSGVSKVVNRVEMRGGSDEESSVQLLNRIKLLVQGGTSNLTENGLKLKLLSVFDLVLKSVEVEASSPIVKGELDVWYIGERLVSEELSTYWFGSSVIPFPKGGVKDVLEVYSGITVYVKDVDWQLVKDDFSVYKGTSKARDKLVWISTNKPAFGSEVRVVYVRNGFRDDIEEWGSANKVLGVNVNYREGEEIYITLSMKIRLVVGFGVSVLEDVKKEIYDYVNNKGLGESLEENELIVVAKGVVGVSSAEVTKLCKEGDSGVYDISVMKSQYVVLNYGDLVIEQWQ